MSGDSIPLYRWLVAGFSAPGRAGFVERIRPHLTPLVRPGDRVLDLCSGAGAVSFLMEDLGATVTGVDNAPWMIEAAREEAARRGSHVDFVAADVLEHDFRKGGYDLVAFLGNAVSDFPPSSFRRLARTADHALRAGGRFVMHYRDGAAPFLRGTRAREGVQTEGPPRITWRLREYLPEEGAVLEVYRNEATGEECEYRHHLYAPAIVRAILEERFRLEGSHALGEDSVLDVFTKGGGA